MNVSSALDSLTFLLWSRLSYFPAGDIKPFSHSAHGSLQFEYCFCLFPLILKVLLWALDVLLVWMLVFLSPLSLTHCIVTLF